jgi:hypothetical protein
MLLAVVGSFLLLEAVFRAWNIGPEAVYSFWNYSPRGLVLTEHVIEDPHPQLGYRLAPGSSGFFKAARFTTNSLGFRGAETGLEKKSGVFRIAVLGASVTLGSGVTDEEVYSSQLQNRLDGVAPGKFEVLNFAVGGYKALQVQKHFWTVAEPFKPDLVLLKFDIETVGEVNQPRRLGELRNRHFELRYHLVDFFSLQAIRMWARDNLQALRRSGWYGYSGHWQYRLPDPAGKQKRTEGSLVSTFSRELARRDYRLMILRLPDIRLRNTERAQRLSEKRWSDWQSRFTYDVVIDTNRQLAGKLSREDRIYPGELHPNARAHALYADAIFEQLWPLLQVLAEVEPRQGE